MPLLGAYFDEAGINREDPWCVVAGYVGTTRQWSLFQDAWLRATRGVDFHAIEFFARDPNGQRVGAYRSWSERRANEYIARILDTIAHRTSYGLRPLACAVEVAAFKRLSPDERRFVTGAYFTAPTYKARLGAPRTPYFVAFLECLGRAAVAAQARGHPSMRVNYFFDRSQRMMSYASLIFQRAQVRGAPWLKDRLGELAFTSRHGSGPMQAADLLAYTVFQVESRGRHLADVAPVMSRFRETHHEGYFKFDDANFQRRLKIAPDSLREMWLESP